MRERLFGDARLRLPGSVVWLILVGFVAFAGVSFGTRMWDTFHPLIANDVTTPLYAQFARNLLRYPLPDTAGLMAELLGDPPSGLIAGEPRTYYTDHPPATVWLIALVNRLLVADPIVAARLMNVAAGIATGLVMLAVVLRRTAPLPALGAMTVLLTLPLFWEHAIVGNFEPATLFFLVAAAVSFWRGLERRAPRLIALAAVMWVGAMLCDWPGYLLGGPMAAALARRRRFGLLVAYTVLGAGTMAAVFIHFDLAVPGGFSAVQFVRGAHAGLLTTPFGEALIWAWSNIVRGFAAWRWLIVLPLLCVLAAPSRTARGCELRFLYLAFLFVGAANDLIFYAWARNHTFWSYYLIPAAVFGGALLFQGLPRVAFAWRPLTLVFRGAAAAVFALSAVTAGKATRTLLRPHFVAPPSIAAMLAEHHVGDLLDPSSEVLVGPYCRRRSPSSARASWPDDMPACEIYAAQGAIPRYWLDRPAVPASEFDPATSSCRNAFVVLRGENVPRLLGAMSLAASEIDWFKWFVLRLSDLPTAYCRNPEKLFEDMVPARQAAAADRAVGR